MLAVHLENLLFLLLLALAGLFQLLGRAARKTNNGEEEQTSESATPIPRAPAQTDEERIRKLMEALGQPAASRPPAPVTPRTDVPPRPVAPVKPPTTFPVPSWKKFMPQEPRKEWEIVKERPPLKAARPAKEVSAPIIRRAPAFEVHESALTAERLPILKTSMEAYAAATRQPSKSAELKTDIATLLSSASRLRDAIILREIFGPPRSLQPLDLL